MGTNQINALVKQYDQIIAQFCEIMQFDKNRIEVNFQALKDVIVRVDMRIILQRIRIFVSLQRFKQRIYVFNV